MANTIQKILSSVAIVAILVVTGCVFNISGFSYTGMTSEKSTHDSIEAGITNVEVFNEFGNVTIEASEDQPTWTWDAKVWADTQELADSQLEVLTLNVQADGNTQSWTFKLPDSPSQLNGVRSNLTLAVPAGVSVTVHNQHGDVSVSNTESNLNLTNAHGNLRANNFLDGVFEVRHGGTEIWSGGSAVVHAAHGGATIKQISGDVDIECHHGRLVVENVSGNVKLDNQHGGVTAVGLAGNSNIETRHGSVTITTAGKETVIKSAHGGVSLVSLTDSFDNINVVNRHGHITLTLPESTQASIDMEIEHGNTSSEIAAVESPRKVDLTNAHGNIKILTSKVVQAEAVE